MNVALRTEWIASLFDQSARQQQTASAVIDRESSRVGVCITVAAGFLMVQVHIEVADSRLPG